MPRQGKTIWVQNFLGLNDAAAVGANPVLTDDLRNIKVKYGKLFGRGGLTKYFGISTASATSLVGLFTYNQVGGTNYLIRITPTAVHKLNTGTSAWDTITGTALTGTIFDRPQFTTIDDTLIFTNEGQDRPRKWTGTGNTANIANSTAPFAKSVEAYLGFLMLGNVSDNGTFTDVVEGSRIIRYSDDWDNDWTLCDGNEINLDDTPGALLAMKVLGRDLICYKTDGVIKVTWVGGPIRFRKEKLPLQAGCVAPLSVAPIADQAHLFLGSDMVLYLVVGNTIRPISNDQLSATLGGLSSQSFDFALVDEEEATYYLFYDRNSVEGYANSYVSYNYRTEAFSRGRLGRNVTAAAAYRPTPDDSVDLVLAAPDEGLVQEFDSGLDDDGIAVDRYYTSNWQSTGEEGYFYGVRLIFKKSAFARVKVSVARDLEQDFQFEQTFSLKGDLASDEHVEVDYRPASPLFCSHYNVKVRFFHDTAATTTELRRIGFELLPLHSLRESHGREGDGASI